MEEREFEIIWDEIASSDFYKVLDYLNLHSPMAVEKVANAILSKIALLSKFPMISELDRFKKDNAGNYRALLVFNYRISYKIVENQIWVLRIRSTAQYPKYF